MKKNFKLGYCFVGRIAILIIFVYSCGLLERNYLKEKVIPNSNYCLVYNRSDMSIGLQLARRINNHSYEVLLNNCCRIYYNNTTIYVKYINYLKEQDSVFSYAVISFGGKREAADRKINIIEEKTFEHMISQDNVQELNN
ncbi:MAG: hypothetical protein J7599_05290 [Niabella sp.]|nr:hypothetical protein [Niabella sp.]